LERKRSELAPLVAKVRDLNQSQDRVRQRIEGLGPKVVSRIQIESQDSKQQLELLESRLRREKAEVRRVQ
jgi:uncharacterized protein YoxC